MVDLTPYKSHIKAASEKAYNAPVEDHTGLFLDHLHLLGYSETGYPEQGQVMRMQAPTDKQGKKSGWYTYYQGEIVSVGVFGNWKEPEQKHIWYSRSEKDLTFQQKVEVRENIKKAQEAQKLEREKIQEEAGQKASEKFNSLPDADDNNPYIKRKQVKAYPHTKQDGNKLVIPVIHDDIITSTQTIYPDGFKRFLTGGKTKGCYFILEGKEDTVYIAEGYSTGASIAEATGCMVYIAFSAHNLYEVASYAKAKHPKIIVCGDNDDTCFSKAEQITSGLLIECLFPPTDHNDFNDWWVADKQAVIDFFLNGTTSELHRNLNGTTSEQKETKKKHTDIHTADTPIFTPKGVLQEIINYYNATAKKDQPLFAIQSAIATCSVILGRNFETNMENRASLFLLNVAKSGTGKEHAKKICEKILEATGNEHLIGGDGYTSSSAVISAAQDKPRHISIIDEFSKYLQASKNKNMGGHMADANAMLMQAIGRLEGKIRAKARSTFGVTKAQKEELQNQYVTCPAITLMGMTTPDDFFETIDRAAIKDGFINRFIVCISDAKRAMPKHREPMEVPESILAWERIIDERKGVTEESPVVEPNVDVIPFNSDCLDIQNEFQQYCIDIANKNEKFGLSEISGRSAEMAYRLALIIALSYNPVCKEVEGWQMQESVNWVKFNLDRMVSELKANVSSSTHEAAKKEILKALRTRKNGISKTRMYKDTPFSKYPRKDLDGILSELFDAELITNEVAESKNGGRKKTIWRAV